jgi:hypothetical protein
MNGDDRRFEEFLRKFEPRRPRPLPSVPAPRDVWRRLTAAAVIFAATGVSIWVCFGQLGRKNVQRNAAAGRDIPALAISVPAISSTMLTRAALEDREQFETETNALARSSLPAFDRSDSTLGALAKE